MRKIKIKNVWNGFVDGLYYFSSLYVGIMVLTSVFLIWALTLVYLADNGTDPETLRRMGNMVILFLVAITTGGITYMIKDGRKRN